MKTYKIILLILALFLVLFIGYSFPLYALSDDIEIVVPLELANDALKSYAYIHVVDKWGTIQWDSFEKVVDRESKWSIVGAHNPKLSSAYGLMGFLNGTWTEVGCTKTNDPYTQIDCGIKYISKNYITPNSAYSFHVQHNWY